ncbi:MAG: hypothetical protein OEQ18_13505 [Gammaproteobacteria bacterium]|nr:hypothetical protein [Gammaproteobacteria bacterium]
MSFYRAQTKRILTSLRACVLIAAILLLSPNTFVLAADLPSFDELPDWSGTWSRRGGTVFDRATWTLDGVLTDPSEPGAGVSDVGTRAHPPYNAEWEAIYREHLALRDQGMFPDPLTRCIAHGFPRIFNVLAPVEFVVRPEQTWVLAEHTRATMRIYTDGRSHPPPEQRWHTFFGDSVGRWEGGKLIFTTVALKGWRDRDSVLDRSGLVLSDQAHATTIMQRVQETAGGVTEDLIRVTITLEDPVALTEPWVVEKRFYKDPPGTSIFDYECNEYNRAIVDEQGRSLILDQDGRVIQ